MIWHYRCPECNRQLEVDWDEHDKEFACPNCRKAHYPPGPSQDHEAFIGGDHWPRDIEDAVIALRGVTCDVPGCYQQYQTLVLRKPASRGGRLSVDNLVPFCLHHARLKGEQDYDDWVRDLSAEERAGPAAELDIVFTEEEPEPPARPATPPPMPAPGRLYPVAGQVRLHDDPPPGFLLVTAQPIPARAWRRLVLDYRCRLELDGPCRVILAAWPCSRPPDWTKGFETAGIIAVEAVHDGAEADCHANRLELDLSGMNEDGLWTAAVFLANSGGRPEITDYLLAGRD